MLKKTISVLLSLIFFGMVIAIYNGCASKGYPSGGPLDKTPPEIVSTFPVADSTDIISLSVINIRFSEMMNESSVANSIFISPPLDFEAEWQSYSELDIILKDSLQKDQTYVLVLGARISDIRNNKMASSFQLAFSTGSYIDQGKISGRVYGLAKNQTLTIFAFDLYSDTLRFDKNRPDYVSQTGDKGDFTLGYLKHASYRIFGVDDQNHNLLIDADLEKIAVPLRDVTLDSSAGIYSGLNFRLTKIDTLAPVFSNIRPRSSTRFDMRLSEKVIIKSLEQISVLDSITQNRIKVLATSKSAESDNMLEVYTSPMDSGRVYFCHIKALSDSSGNMAKDTSISFVAARYVQPDTFKISTYTPADSARSLHPSLKIYLEFNNPLDRKSLSDNFRVTGNGRETIQGIFSYPSAYEAEFSSNQKFLLDSLYTIRLDMARVKNIWGDSLADSMSVRRFIIGNGDEYGEISGMVSSKDLTVLPAYIEAVRLGRKNEKYTSWLFDKSDYRINFVPEGNYQMHAYQDLDSSGSYSAGHLFPFRFSEPFIFSDDTVKVRKRWETSGVHITFPGKQ